jgi:DNA-binding NtrC family response regulator
MEKIKPIRIFIVEDDPMYARLMQRALEQQKYEVHVFTTGEEMISTWEEDPDIILLDYYIEPSQGVYMNGEKILRFIRRISKSLPVISLTATPDISRATEMLKLGAVDFIVKDTEGIKNLQNTISQILEARKLQEDMANNKMQIQKYRQRFAIFVLIIALAAVTLLWLFS